MDAGETDVQPTVGFLVHVQLTLRVQDVEFRTEQQPHISPLTRNHMHIPEIEGVACAGNRLAVFRDAQDGQPFALAFRHHFRQGAVRMAGGDGVGMDI